MPAGEFLLRRKDLAKVDVVGPAETTDPRRTNGCLAWTHDEGMRRDVRFVKECVRRGALPVLPTSTLATQSLVHGIQRSYPY